MTKNIISIIGGAGFVGTRLASRLMNDSVDFEIYDKNTEKPSIKKTIKLDVRDGNSLNKISSSSVIINLAAEHRDDVKPKQLYYDVNVEGASNVCKFARASGINKIIFTSSVAIYGFASPNTKEDGRPNYFNEYGRTKYLAEKEYIRWQKEDPKNRSLVIIRPTVIFGEGNRGNVYNLLKQIKSKKFIMLGKGNNYKSMAYVENVAAFIQFSISFKEGIHIYNYIDKPDVKMNDLIKKTRKLLFNKDNIGIKLPGFVGILIGHTADLLSMLTKIKLPVSAIRVKKFMSTTQFSSSIDKTTFKAPISLEDGLMKTINYEFIEDNSNKPTFDTE